LLLIQKYGSGIGLQSWRCKAIGATHVVQEGLSQVFYIGLSELLTGSQPY